MPPLVRCESFRSETNLSGHTQLELIVGYLQEGQQLADEDSYVLLVDQSVRKLESSPTNGNISIPETV